MRRSLSILLIGSLLAPSPLASRTPWGAAPGRPPAAFLETALTSRALFHAGGPITAKRLTLSVFGAVVAYYLAGDPAMLLGATLPIPGLLPLHVKRHDFVVTIQNAKGKKRKVDLIQEIFAGRFKESMLEGLTPADAAPRLPRGQDSFGYLEAKALSGFGRKTLLHLLSFHTRIKPSNESDLPSANRYHISRRVMRRLMDLMRYEDAARQLSLSPLTIYSIFTKDREVARAWGFIDTKVFAYVSRKKSAPILAHTRRIIPMAQATEALRAHGFKLDHFSYNLWLTHPERYIGKEEAERRFPSPWPRRDAYNGLDLADFNLLVRALQDRQKALSETWTVAAISEEIRRQTVDPKNPETSGWVIPNRELYMHFRDRGVRAGKKGRRMLVPHEAARTLIKAQVKDIRAFQRFSEKALGEPAPYTIGAAKAIVKTYGQDAVLKQLGLTRQKTHVLLAAHSTLRKKTFRLLGLSVSAPHIVLLALKDFERLFQRVGAAIQAAPEAQLEIGTQLTVGNERAGALLQKDVQFVHDEVKKQTGWELPLDNIKTVLVSKLGHVKWIDLDKVIGFKLRVISRASLEALVTKQVAGIAEIQQFYKTQFSQNGGLTTHANALALQQQWNTHRLSRDLGHDKLYMSNYLLQHPNKIPTLHVDVIGVPPDPPIVSARGLEAYPKFHPHLVRKRLTHVEAQLMKPPLAEKALEKKRMYVIFNQLRHLSEAPVFRALEKLNAKMGSTLDELLDTLDWASRLRTPQTYRKEVLARWKSFTDTVPATSRQVSRAA